jgi:5-methylcytosine-specific restriction enzyme A
MSTHRILPEAGWADLHVLPRGPSGRRQCRRCAREVPKGRRTFCSSACVHEWRLRTDPSYVRDQLFIRDRGICAACRTDTVAVASRLARLSRARRKEELTALGWPTHRRITVSGGMWDADHIVPVSEGGGGCGLENYRTLCVPCHRRSTSELRARLAAARY